MVRREQLQTQMPSDFCFNKSMTYVTIYEDVEVNEKTGQGPCTFREGEADLRVRNTAVTSRVASGN